MLLSDLKSYLSNAKRANVLTISQQLNTVPDVTLSMLDIWVRKGKVRKVPKCAGCKSTCLQCDPVLTEVYEWVA